jgi:hypothetical protein
MQLTPFSSLRLFHSKSLKHCILSTVIENDLKASHQFWWYHAHICCRCNWEQDFLCSTIEADLQSICQLIMERMRTSNHSSLVKSFLPSLSPSTRTLSLLKILIHLSIPHYPKNPKSSVAKAISIWNSILSGRSVLPSCSMIR